MDVKPWEPVKWAWYRSGWNEEAILWWKVEEFKTPGYPTKDGAWDYHCFLANGQRIIVRALSEDRKAARAAMKEANR